jgi:hypothetical protein
MRDRIIIVLFLPGCKKTETYTKASVKGVQHFNLPLKEADDSEEFVLDKYCGYDVGNEFHQAEVEAASFNQHRETKIEDAMISLDSQSTHSTFYMQHLVTNICDATRPLKMITIAGAIVYTQQADLPDYRTLWFNKNSIVSIISMSEAERRGHKIFFSPGCLTLTNVNNGNKTDFRITPAGLYAFKIPSEGSTMVQTIEENKNYSLPNR